MKKIILVGIVKNEEQTIPRCIESALPILDGICITDTGSTDKTIEKIINCAGDIPCKIYKDDWKNFGHNRTSSFLNAKNFIKENGWDLETTYGLLLDADMKLMVGKFNKESLISDHYTMIQESSSLSYFNTRLVRMNLDWKCVGVTHEYWSCENEGHTSNKIPKHELFIQDIGDGGSKGDKFERDIRLLQEGIRNEPNNSRYHFYLAQSYKDVKKYEDAISYYTKRINMGGWVEEVWYSYYMIGECYKNLGNEDKFVEYAMEAYKNRPQRAESIYSLVKYFREKSQYQKAHKYYMIGKRVEYPKDDMLFIEKNVYTHLFDYEYTIIHYYLFPNKRHDGLKESIKYLNTYDSQTNGIVFNNMEYYMQRLLDYGKKIELNISNYNMDFVSSSISFVDFDDKKILANIRFVNYRIVDDGSYMMSKGGVLSKTENVKTENGYMFFDKELNAISNVKMMQSRLNDIKPQKDVNICGLEDIRLYKTNDNKICYSATTLEYSYDKCLRIITGEYDINTCEFINNKRIAPPVETNCEKNWIGYSDIFIYKWYPLQVGTIDNDNDTISKLKIIKSIDTPPLFKYLRGSSNLVEHNDELWCITHFVKYTTPRKYFHTIVVLDKNMTYIKRYTLPFYFDNIGIEFCLGMNIIDDTLYASVSRYDANPIVCKIAINNLTWI